MNKLDMIILAVYFLCTLYGFFHGIIKTFLPLFVIVLLSYFYFRINLPPVIMVFNKIPVQSYILKIFIAVVIFIICLVIIHKLSDLFEKFRIITLIDRIIGGVCGFIIATFVVYGVCYVSMFFLSSTITVNSKFYPYIEKFFSTFVHYVK